MKNYGRRFFFFFVNTCNVLSRKTFRETKYDYTYCIYTCLGLIQSCYIDNCTISTFQVNEPDKYVPNNSELYP